MSVPKGTARSKPNLTRAECIIFFLKDRFFCAKVGKSWTFRVARRWINMRETRSFFEFHVVSISRQLRRSCAFLVPRVRLMKCVVIGSVERRTATGRSSDMSSTLSAPRQHDYIKLSLDAGASCRALLSKLWSRLLHVDWDVKQARQHLQKLCRLITPRDWPYEFI